MTKTTPPLLTLWAVVEIVASDGFAQVEPVKWETWWPGGDAKKIGGHIGKWTMRKLVSLGWVTVDGPIARVTYEGRVEALRFQESGYER